MPRIFIFILLVWAQFPLGIIFGQNPTIGVTHYSPEVSDGYLLFSPMAYPKTYLIDNCGREIHQWESEYFPGLSSYLSPEGNLVRTKRVVSTVFTGGGIGGGIEIMDWDGNLLWDYIVANDSIHQHHDIELLPNGNILVLCWELLPKATALDLGRDPVSLTSDLWTTYLFEVEPIGSDSGNIVWEWHLKDHLCQEFSALKQNYMTVEDHPERLNINYLGPLAQATGRADWIHSNSVDYNPEKDQIIINSRNLCEFWIIDHSTSTAEASQSIGGNAGKGGDLLYRWGNPASYQQGDELDRDLFEQHDAHWIESGKPGEGSILIFNNGLGRSMFLYSSVDVMTPPYDGLFNYSMDGSGTFGPDNFDWTYVDPLPEEFYSQNVSGAERMDNGNTLICEGGDGRLFEVDENGEIVWDYVIPTGTNGPVEQGMDPVGNISFRVYKYLPDFSGFDGKDLSPGDRIELNPDSLPELCDSVVGLNDANTQSFLIFPNPGNGLINFVNPFAGSWATLFSIEGKEIKRIYIFKGKSKIDLSFLNQGIYFLRTDSGKSFKIIIE